MSNIPRLSTGSCIRTAKNSHGTGQTSLLLSQDMGKEKGKLHRDYSIQDYMKVVTAVTESGLRNYESYKIALPSSFNTELWTQKLKTTKGNIF